MPNIEGKLTHEERQVTAASGRYRTWLLHPRRLEQAGDFRRATQYSRRLCSSLSVGTHATLVGPL
jgi:hypothetical protein